MKPLDFGFDVWAAALPRQPSGETYRKAAEMMERGEAGRCCDCGQPVNEDGECDPCWKAEEA